MPWRLECQSARISIASERHDTVEQVVADPGEMDASHSGERDVSRESPTLWLQRDQDRGAFELLANGIWRLRSILPPPFLRGMNLRAIARSLISTRSGALTRGYAVDRKSTRLNSSHRQ